MKTQCEGVLSSNGGTQYGAVGGSQWMLALKLEPLLCVPNPRESESTVLTEVECWHPLATANGSVLRAMSGLLHIGSAANGSCSDVVEWYLDDQVATGGPLVECYLDDQRRWSQACRRVFDLPTPRRSRKLCPSCRETIPLRTRSFKAASNVTMP